MKFWNNGVIILTKWLCHVDSIYIQQAKATHNKIWALFLFKLTLSFGPCKGLLKIPLFAMLVISSRTRRNFLIWSSLIWYDNCKNALPHERKIMLISCTFNNNVIFFRRTILEKYFWPLDCRQNWSLNNTVRPFIADFAFWSMCYMSKLGAKFPALLVDENIIRFELLSFFSYN